MKFRFALLGLFALFFIGCDGEKIAAINESAPEIVAMDLNGKSVNLSDFSDRAVALIFYKNGCESCTDSLPKLDNFAQKNAQITLIAINATNSKNEILEFMEDNPLPNTQIAQDSLKITSQKFAIVMTPTIILLDKNHIMREKIVGAQSWERVEAKLKAMLDA